MDIYSSDIYSGEPGTDTYSVAYYVNAYIKKLKDAGFDGISSGRLLTYSEVYLGIAKLYKNSEEPYWIGTAYNYGNLYFITNDGSIGGSFYLGVYSEKNTYGVRPLIYINTDDNFDRNR